MFGIIELSVIMLLVAGVAFLPLGYFIYMYTAKNGEPFGEIEPHGDHESPLLNAVGKVINNIKERVFK
jgi:hypothetical protein